MTQQSYRKVWISIGLVWLLINLIGGGMLYLIYSYLFQLTDLPSEEAINRPIIEYSTPTPLALSLIVPTTQSKAVATASARPNPQPTTGASSESASDDDSESLYAIGPLNAWITAMTTDDPLLAAQFFRPGPEAERTAALDAEFQFTRAFFNQAIGELGDVNGYMTLGSYPGETADQRIGLGKAYFVGGSICFRVALVKHEGRWYAAGWEPITPDECKAELARIPQP